MTTRTLKRRETAPSDDAAALAPPRRASVPRFSLEGGLVVALAVTAFALRVGRADWMPLDTGEASIALAAWRAAHALPAGVVGAPLFYHLERLAFWMLGDADRVARFIPAVFGALVVLLAPGLRRPLGAAGALAAAGIFALSPLWTFWGRQVSEVTVGTFAVMIVLAVLWSEAARRSWLLPAALGLAIVAGGPARPALIAGLMVLVGAFARGKGRLVETEWSALAGADGGRRWLITLVVTALLAASGLLTALDGIGAAVAHWGAWFGRLGTAGEAWNQYLLPLLVYGTLTAVMGAVGVFAALWRRSTWGVLLVVWTMLALLAGLLAGRPEALSDVYLPLTLLAAMTMGGLAELVARQFTWSEDGVMIAMLVVVLLYALNYAVAVAEVNDPSGSNNMLQLTAALLIVVSLLVILTVVWRNTLVLRVAGTAGVLSLSLLAWANGSSLNYRPTVQLREPLRPTYVAPGARQLAEDLSMASWFNTRDPNAMAVVADPALRPLLEWYLRHMPVTWRKPEGKLDARAVITVSDKPIVAGAPAAFGPGAYRGRPYAVQGRWVPEFGSLRAFLQWYLQRRTGTNVAPELAAVRVTDANLYLQVDPSTPAEAKP